VNWRHSAFRRLLVWLDCKLAIEGARSLYSLAKPQLRRALVQSAAVAKRRDTVPVTAFA